MKPPKPRPPVLALLLAIVPVAFAADGVAGRSLGQLELKDGTVLHNVTVLSVQPGYVMAKWDDGRGSIAAKRLPDEVRASLGIPAETPKMAADDAAQRFAPSRTSDSYGQESAATSSGSELLPTEIELTNGFVMHDCVVSRWRQDSIDVKFVGGTAPIKFANIVPRQREIYLRHRDAGLRLQHQLDTVAAVRGWAQDQIDQTQRTAAQQARAREEETAERVHQALADHKVVVGMTEAQVREAVGSPTRTRTASLNGSTMVAWIYDNRFKFENGFNTPWQVYFSDGVMVGESR